ncbi:MAG: hypothetical protein QMD07_05355 [Thermodesulfovibrionales bacterium]|nr:hypothetical protein [Thermodesulfovibrionales bacterium]
MKIKSAVILLTSLLVSAMAFANEPHQSLSLSGHVTYGSYSGSQQRDSILSETIKLSYMSFDKNNYGLDISLKSSVLNRKQPLSDIDGFNADIAYFLFYKLNDGNYLGGRIAVHHISSDDNNSDNTLIPYVSAAYKSSDGSKYFDAGYAHIDYDDTIAKQYTATGGFALFNRKLWSQTRFYYNDLSKMVQSKNNAFAVEEKIAYYAIPKKLTLSLYALFGERLYAYDPDLGIAYNVADIQKGSAGFSAVYNITERLEAYADITYERFKNSDINDKYGVTYYTGGLKYTF